MQNQHDQQQPATAEQTVGRQMKFFRAARGISQAELARRLTALGIKLDDSAITRTERGTRPIRVNELAAIAAVLDVSVPSLLQETPMPEVAFQIARQEVADLQRQEAVIAVELDAARARVERLAAELGVQPWAEIEHHHSDGTVVRIPGAPSPAGRRPS